MNGAAGDGSGGGWRFWVDRGGTFTDLVARAPDGAMHTHKLLSENPERYADAAVQGIRDLLGLAPGAPIPPGAVESVKMGTTVATNALLERKGARTALVITEGLGDLLRIGYQNRPKLFDLDIRLPEQLYERVIEAPERLDAEGAPLRALEPEPVRAALEAAYADGVRAVAIALMHSYRNSAHEDAVAAIAAEIGFPQISVSHQASPLIKLVGRGDTTVVDAYLSPILRRYVAQVSAALTESEESAALTESGESAALTESGESAALTESLESASLPPSDKRAPTLLFMQSNGGLTDARLFQGKDSILSGPAGGVVGMVRTGEAAGFRELIGFDMGGTSTDVCHYAGVLERSFDAEVAGVRMRAPMMSIHTVAAGGGSILSFRDGRMQAGPESAGANPGPACYRRGGPLTVTDCNVVLGKLQPDLFPKVFGPGGDEPLDPAAPRAKFEALAGEIAAATGDAPMAVEALAEGFLRIAVENMANAIKKISVERGYDASRYAINCFGGAGGQHVCQVADVLGVETALIHPYAGVLSAFGMGLADIRALREAQHGRSLADTGGAAATLDALAEAASGEVLAQGVAPEALRVERTVHVRAGDAQQILPVPFGALETMRAAFVEAHQARFGFRPNPDDLIAEMVSVEAVGAAGDQPERAAAQPTPGAGLEQAQMYCGGRWVTAPVRDRAALAPGAETAGPALIVEPTGANIVEPGWVATVRPSGDLVLERREPRAAADPAPGAADASVDPMLLEVFNNLFMSIAEQMGATLANTAYSVNIKERKDFSCALFTPEGDLVANAPHVPVHLGSMSDSVRAILRDNAGDIRPGDAFMTNNPFNGGTHLPDVTVITPMFDAAGERILFIVASRGHHADIGGKTPGSAPPDSREISEEGVVIDTFKLVRGGVLQDAEARALLTSGRYPCRNVEQNMADLAAQIAANETGVRELEKAVGVHGVERVHAYMGHVQDNAEECVRRVIDALADSRFAYRLDSGAEIKVSISVDKAARRAVIDFAGTAAQDPGNYNAPLSISRAVALYVFRTLVGADIPMNEGCLKPLDIRVPEGSMLNPRPPAAVISGNTEVSQAMAEALYGALGVLAGSQGTMNNFVYGDATYQNYETICGGVGAGPGHDGASAVHSHMTNTLMTDPEVLETRFPVRLDAFEIRRGSGGAGRWRGGDGIVRRLRFMRPMTVTVLTSHRETQPYGVAGGAPGAAGENWVLRADGRRERLGGNDRTEMAAGDVFEMRTPGGGGYGAPD